MAKPNWLEELSDQQRQAVLLGLDAYREHTEFHRKSYDRWMAIARGVAPICALADRAGMSRDARKNRLKEVGFIELDGATVSRLLWLAKLETQIRIWRDGLTPRQRDRWASPSSICNRCPAVKKAIAEANKGKPQRGPRRAPVKDLEVALDFIAENASRLAPDEQAKLFARFGGMVDLTPSTDKALDVYREYLEELDEDERREALKDLVADFGFTLVEQEPEPEPEPAKPKRKSRAKAKPASTTKETAEAKASAELTPGFTRTAEEALAEERANTTFLVAGGVSIPLPTTKPAKKKPAKKKTFKKITVGFIPGVGPVTKLDE
jgi:hypothetical protein